MQVADRVASGDLGSRIDITRGDEAGQLLHALGRMNTNLAAIVGQVRDGSGAISQASHEIASGNQHLSAHTEQQAGALEETAASMEELTSTVRQNTEHARRANGLAANAALVAGEGGRMVADVVGTMRLGSAVDAVAARAARVPAAPGTLGPALSA